MSSPLSPIFLEIMDFLEKARPEILALPRKLRAEIEELLNQAQAVVAQKSRGCGKAFGPGLTARGLFGCLENKGQPISTMQHKNPPWPPSDRLSKPFLCRLIGLASLTVNRKSHVL
jgi:hypothetical protein